MYSEPRALPGPQHKFPYNPQVCAKTPRSTIMCTARSPQAVVDPSSAELDPFSPHAFLPLVSALDRIVERFAALHLVRYG